MAKYGKMQKVIVSILGVMLVASLLLAVGSLLAPVRKAIAGPPEPEGYCDYFWSCWKKHDDCSTIGGACYPGGCDWRGAKFVYHKYYRYAGACEACPSPCCWRDPHLAKMTSCNGSLETCPSWCPGSP